ncbi:UDP-2,3-diacylglucosamine pyrophosphatase LpxH [Tistlia consotensis]|uniref:UDP-2,3-diacylglucosamine pyrophosphatase LpxH n=1 Tax=Tistlia consotensis USBA 355 TaxID=560819 RepID=A0A1Y6CLR0_9PROT|nr:UDP-2,3-diacylglucosamine diphosphatase [Tistlia consotensis]SMF62314.1 UDP-2,3-diacylglucosamine pyrophosphatase LpxH [Tistlia consotensis USBA 355]SNR94526.1 UDP-2,3-diacylglucosamine pyrophosphatase LpxH [Tistlia consotensis]
MQASLRSQRYRTIFLSDIHLGTRGCKAEFLLDFLRFNEAETIYLVGDIFDGWRLRRSWYWPQAHNDVVQKLLRKARKGARLIYLPGNHDELLRAYTGRHFGGVEVMSEAIHETADGRRMLVLHGDAFDGIVTYAKWLARLGDWTYNLALTVNHWFNLVRRRFGFGYWSMSAWLKGRVKNAVQFIDQYEQAVAEEARRRGVDGVICGHIHKAEQRMIGEVLYINDGDWVESCTALVEHFDGRLEILNWAELRNFSMLEAARALPELEEEDVAQPAAAARSGLADGPQRDLVEVLRRRLETAG